MTTYILYGRRDIGASRLHGNIFVSVEIDARWLAASRFEEFLLNSFVSRQGNGPIVRAGGSAVVAAAAAAIAAVTASITASSTSATVTVVAAVIAVLLPTVVVGSVTVTPTVPEPTVLTIPVTMATSLI